jgi:hypothetical protein
MTFALFEDRGTPLAKQRCTWRELAGKPTFRRVRMR